MADAGEWLNEMLTNNIDKLDSRHRAIHFSA